MWPPDSKFSIYESRIDNQYSCHFAVNGSSSVRHYIVAFKSRDDQLKFIKCDILLLRRDFAMEYSSFVDRIPHSYIYIYISEKKLDLNHVWMNGLGVLWTRLSNMFLYQLIIKWKLNTITQIPTKKLLCLPIIAYIINWIDFTKIFKSNVFNCCFHEEYKIVNNKSYYVHLLLNYTYETIYTIHIY